MEIGAKANLGLSSRGKESIRGGGQEEERQK